MEHQRKKGLSFDLLSRKSIAWVAVSAVPRDSDGLGLVTVPQARRLILDSPMKFLAAAAVSSGGS